MSTARWIADSEIMEHERPASDGQPLDYDIKRYVQFFHPPWAAGEAPRPRVVSRGPRRGRYRVVYVNGIMGNPYKHVAQALAVSAVSGGRVTGVYNASNGFVRDLRECLSDKATSSLLMKARAAVVFYRPFGSSDSVKLALARHLRLYNRASASLFEYLAEPTRYRTHIVAHSQGNIIVSNAVNALIALRGRECVDGLRIHAVASPVTFWGEAKPVVTEYRFANDAVGWLSLRPGFSPARAKGWKAVEREGSKSQVVAGYERSWNPANVLTHNFYTYLQNLWVEMSGKFP